MFDADHYVCISICFFWRVPREVPGRVVMAGNVIGGLNEQDVDVWR